MSNESFSVSELAKRLESCDDAEFITILNELRSPAYVNEQLLKTELALLLTKTLALLRSNQENAIWRGCQTAVVVCSYNPLVLCAHSGQLLAAIYSKLEQKVEYYPSSSQSPQSKVLLETLVFALSSIMNLMRGKPAISREALVPKLKAIIPTLITLAQYDPPLALPALKKLLYKHTTTFKPFANKFRLILVKLITTEYEHFDKETRQLVTDNYAYLHLIKLQASATDDEAQAHHKSYQDDNWRLGVFGIISQFKPILDICGEILELEQDKEVQNFLNSLTFANYIKVSETSDFLPGLKIDLNSPLMLWELPRRLNLLVDLLSSFISLPTPYPVRIPLGACVSISEAMLSMTKNFLPLKREIRSDAELKSVVRGMLPQVQFSGIRLLSTISRTFGKICSSMLPSILGSLDLFIPLQEKSSKIDLSRCDSLKMEMTELFLLVNSLIPHMGHQLQEVDFFSKLIEVALYLTEQTSVVDSVFNQQRPSGANKKIVKKQKKDISSGSLSDLYTHPDKFRRQRSDCLLLSVNRFLCMVVGAWNLPSTQQLRIIKYSISTAVHFKEVQGFIPTSLIELLRTEVVHPGDERVSILPIAISLLKGSKDQVFDILCHPRLPTSMVNYVRTLPEKIEESSVEDEEDDIEDDERSAEDQALPAIIENPVDLAREQVDKTGNVVIEESLPVEIPTQASTSPEKPENELIFKKRELEVETVPIENPKRAKVLSEPTVDIREEVIVDKIEETEATEEKNASSDEDSEFEIPKIHLSDDEDEEEDE